MPALVVIGSQWGDEGKGKFIDILSSKADFVVRYQGGANAGHTLKVGDEEIIVHLIPSAIFHPEVKCLISGGVVLDISALCEEIQKLKNIGKLKNDMQLIVSDSATLLLEHHKRLDQAREEWAGQKKIGTTGKGIGPAYESRAARKALLFADLFDEDSLLFEKLNQQIQETNVLLSQLYNQKPVSPEKSFDQIRKCRSFLKAYRCQDMSLLIDEALKKNKKVLFEGAQGALLDLYHGTYPYVTSSSTLAGGALTASGLGFHHFADTLAITKAYTTRVGSGPFPTECSQTPAGFHLQKKGKEFGATTGRERRCGWMDMPALKYAIRLNGANRLALMKLDVLTGLEEIKVCTAYEIETKLIQNFPALLKNFEKVKPIYKSFKGWDQDLSSIQSRTDLPKPALEYIDFISTELNITIDAISVGPSRSQTIYLNNLF